MLQELERTLALLAFDDPANCPFGDLLNASHRQKVRRAGRGEVGMGYVSMLLGSITLVGYLFWVGSYGLAYIEAHWRMQTSLILLHHLHVYFPINPRPAGGGKYCPPAGFPR